MNESRGFTLIELIVYTAIFAIVAGILTSIFLVIINSQKKTSVSNEVTQQLNFVLVTAKRLIGDSSLVEAVYEGANPSSTCSSFCTLKLRRTDPTKDPTIISSNASGIYLQEGSSTQVTLTTNKVLVNNLRLVKHEIPGGHAVVEISTSFSYNTSNPTFALTKAIQSAIARVNAATFDADLIPNQDNTFDIGQIGSNLRWKNGRFSGDLTVAGNVGIGTTSPLGALHVIKTSEQLRLGYNDTNYTSFTTTANGTLNISPSSGNTNITGQVKITGGSPGAGKVLTSDNAGLASWQSAPSIPSGAVMSFNLSTCPSGWSEFTSGRGRYIVGLPSGGTLASATGTALTNLENRAAGSHVHGLHTADDYGPPTGERIPLGYKNNGGHLIITDYGRADQNVKATSTATAVIGNTETGTVYIPNGSPLISGTNAPYIQLLTCQKD